MFFKSKGRWRQIVLKRKCFKEQRFKEKVVQTTSVSRLRSGEEENVYTGRCVHEVGFSRSVFKEKMFQTESLFAKGKCLKGSCFKRNMF